MSDMPGLALGARGSGPVSQRRRTNTRALVIGAVVAGLAAGVRVQTACLTLPLFALALVQQRRLGLWWIASRPLAGAGDRWTRLGDSAGRALGRPRRLSRGARIAGGRGLRLDRTCCGRRRRRAGCCSPCGRPSCSRGSRSRSAIVVGVLAAGRRARSRSLRHAIRRAVHRAGVRAVRHLSPAVSRDRSRAVCDAHAAGDGVARRVRGIRSHGWRRRSVSALVVAAALWYAVPIGIAYGREAHPAFRAIRRNAGCRARPCHRPPCMRTTRCGGRLQAAASRRDVDRRAASQLRVARPGELLA